MTRSQLILAKLLITVEQHQIWSLDMDAGGKMGFPLHSLHPLLEIFGFLLSPKTIAQQRLGSGAALGGQHLGNRVHSWPANQCFCGVGCQGHPPQGSLLGMCQDGPDAQHNPRCSRARLGAGAAMDNTSDCASEDYRFESCLAH